MAGASRQSEDKTLIRGTVFTLIGFCLWQSAFFVMSAAVMSSSTALISGFLISILMFIRIFWSWGIGSAVYTMMRKYADRKQYRSLLEFRTHAMYAAALFGAVLSLLTLLCSDRISVCILGEGLIDQMDMMRHALYASAFFHLCIPVLTVYRAFAAAIDNRRIVVVSEITEYGLLLFLLLAAAAAGKLSLPVLIAVNTVSLLAVLAMHFLLDMQMKERVLRRDTEEVKSESFQMMLRRFGRSALPYAVSGMMIALPMLLDLPVYLRLFRKLSVSAADVSAYAKMYDVFRHGLSAIMTAIMMPVSLRFLNEASDRIRNKEDSSRFLERYFCGAVIAVVPMAVICYALGPYVWKLLHISLPSAGNGEFVLSSMLDAFVLMTAAITAAAGNRRELSGYLLISLLIRYGVIYAAIHMKRMMWLYGSVSVSSAALIFLVMALLANRRNLRMSYVGLRCGIAVYAGLCMNGLFAAGKLLMKDHYRLMMEKAWGMLLGIAAGAALYLFILKVLRLTDSVYRRKR